MSQPKIRMYRPDGMLVDKYQDPILDWAQFRQESRLLLKETPCQDPRYGRIEEVGSGEELFVRHSWNRGHRMLIVLKRQRTGRVVCHLADFDRRSLNWFCGGRLAADKELARLAGLLPMLASQSD